ncbi:MAG: Hsp20/alpha crystallin family protein [Hyphomicrobiales bacterium]
MPSDNQAPTQTPRQAPKQVPQTSSETGTWPFLQTFQSEMNNLFDRFNGTAPWHEPHMVPAIDVAETDAEVEVSVDVPGMDQNDLDISIANQNLVIKGTKSNEREDSTKDWHMVERSYGSFRRVVPLGFTPGDNDVDATYEKGVLNLRIKKHPDAEASSRKIEIKAS